MCAVNCGVLTPSFTFISNLSHLPQKSSLLSYPLITKHYNGYGSVGISKESKITSYSQLEIQTGKLLSEFGGALIEEFIEGREFTVLVAENPED
jgi:D-alanine-D-alanine ligase